MKRFFSFVLSALLLLGAVIPGFAADEPALLTYQKDVPEVFTKNGIIIDPRNHTGDNPDLKPGVHYNMPTWGKVLSLMPQGENGSVIPQSFDVKFKIEEKDTYHFGFTIYETADAKAGTPRKIDLCLDGGQTYRIVEKAVQQGKYLFYDGLSAELTPGEHTITITTCTGNGFQAAFSEIYIAGTNVTPPADEANLAEEEKIDTTVKGEHKMTNGETVKSLVGTASMPSVFKYADKLDLSAEMTAQKGSDKNKNLVEGTSGDYYIDTAFQNAACVIPRRDGSAFTAWPEFAIEFTVPEDGTYHFCVGAYVRGDDAWSNANWKHASSVRIDDGEVFSVNEDDLTNLGKNTVNYFLGMSAELTAGTHTLYLIADRQIGLNAYFKSLHYYREGAEPTAPETPDTPDTPETPVTPSVTPNAAGSLVCLPEMTETMAGGDLVTLDVRDFASDNPSLVEGTDYTAAYISKGNWGDVLCLIPKSKDQPVTWNIKFTVADAGKYEFSVGIWTSTDAKTSTPRKIDVFVDGGEKYRITESPTVAVNNIANFYGMTMTLTKGEHTFSFRTCTPNGLQCYLNSLSYSMIESTDTFDPAIESTWGDRNVPEGDTVYVEAKPVDVQLPEEIATDAPGEDAPATDAPDTGAQDTDAPDTTEPDTTEPDTDEPNAADAGMLNGVIIGITAVIVAAIAVAAVVASRKKK